ncbi:DDE superfamily endonuclease [Popillia japonica]|uniref:DDE superfamily endonuclease n=1 Tax=Popillia japonica TaxID=7064 RepID=A0AAW1IBX9_POPJA
MKGAPSENIFPTPNGWMTAETFLKWLRHFAWFTKPSADDAALLIVDGHRSHKELDVTTYARENHVHMLSIPPHTTHKLQPLDITFMKPFKNCYNISCNLWTRAPQLLFQYNNSITFCAAALRLVYKTISR